MKFSKLKVGLIAAGAGLLPFVASADTAGSGVALTTLEVIEKVFAQIVSTAIPILLGVAVIIFFIGLISYIRSGDHTKGLHTMIAGIVGIFVMVCLWGIISLIGTTFGVQTVNANLQPPTVNGLPSSQ